MAEIGYSSVIHLVGLGGAGTNIVESFLKNEKTMDLLKTGVARLSLMALDIADPDIKSLEEAHKIVTEQEDALSREEILTEILDVEHFKDYMRSVIRVYRTPNIMGLKSSFRSDYLWVTVQSPPGLWDSDLTQELNTALAAYVTGDVSKTITVREVAARDPWVIRIVVVGARGKVEDLAPYDERERINRRASDFEASLSRSFLVEHNPSLQELLKKLR